MLDLNRFISEYVTKRPLSMFAQDIESNKKALEKKISGKSILVIGGAGSIGKSFIKAILPFCPSSLVIVDINENELAEVTRDLRSTKGMIIPDTYITYPMDYASPIFEKMFRANSGFDIIANFSAHKHVRSEKDIFSVEALIYNNLINANQLLKLMTKYPPEVYFCVSTDKAANPVNIMGASKRLMEDLIFSYSEEFDVKTARFANVAFSNGSLPAGFLKRIENRQPISAPSDISRYFVSPEESGQICMLACFLGGNREIFFPKLEKEQEKRFDEIAEELLSFLGYGVIKCDSEEEAICKAEMLKNGSNQYPVFFSKSNTTGEKPYEEFFTSEEVVDLDRFSALGVITKTELPSKKDVEKMLETLEKEFLKENPQKESVVQILRRYLPSFSHAEKGYYLDSKM